MRDAVKTDSDHAAIDYSAKRYLHKAHLTHLKRTALYCIINTKGGDYVSQINVTIRMDRKLKSEAEKLFHELGLNMTTALTMFTKAAVREQRIPLNSHCLV